MVDESVLVKAAIEKAYRDRGGGFLAWAKRHAPDEETAEDDLKDAFIKAIANVSALSMVEDVASARLRRRRVTRNGTAPSTL